MAGFTELLQKEKMVLVDFHAEWCGPCKLMAPVLKDVKTRIGDKATILKIDVDKSPNTAAAYQIQGVPTLILFKEGRIVWRQSGVVPAKQLEMVIDQFR